MDAMLRAVTVQRWKKLMGGPHPLVGEEAGRDTLLGLVIVGPGRILELGRFGSPRPFSYFCFLFLFFFCFLFLFLFFCNLDSNQIKTKS
jgi:hypothetical protein